jgi:hypothetical protein
MLGLLLSVLAEKWLSGLGASVTGPWGHRRQTAAHPRCCSICRRPRGYARRLPETRAARTAKDDSTSSTTSCCRFHRAADAHRAARRVERCGAEGDSRSEFRHELAAPRESGRQGAIFARLVATPGILDCIERHRPVSVSSLNARSANPHNGESQPGTPMPARSPTSAALGVQLGVDAGRLRRTTARG